jgi:paraquat-inducible protein B
MAQNDNPQTNVPESRVVSKKRGRFSVIWVVPMAAAAVGIWVGVTTIRNQGPKITIEFRSAEGLEAGNTKIRYNGLDIGMLTTVRLSEDHQKVVATARMSPKTEPFLVKDTKFWVVRAQISGASITGLGTLISGAYIGSEIGQSKESERHFVAEEDAPMETGGIHGRFFKLTTPQLGSLTKGTPLFYRRLQAGQVVSYELNPDGKTLDVKVFVQHPYDQFITSETRFWQASGVDVSLTANGLQVQTESFLSILIGGIAFETPLTTNSLSLPAAEAGTSFALFKDREDAFRPPPKNPQTYVLLFKEPVRGLEVGAPVILQGIQIGEVTDTRAQFDSQSFSLSVPVTIKVDPERFGVRVSGDSNVSPEELRTRHRKVMDTLVARGLRAQLRTGSLITGSLYVAADFFPEAPPVTLDWSQNPVQLPTTPGQMESLQNSIVGIVKKLDQLQLQKLLDDLHKTLGTVDDTLVVAQGTLTNVSHTVANAGTLLAPDSTLDTELNGTLQEVGGAARGLRLLADYLERHPESLIRGKSGEAK